MFYLRFYGGPEAIVNGRATSRSLYPDGQMRKSFAIQETRVGQYMKRIFFPSHGPTHWRQFLGNPDVHWKRGRSAFELAVSWELAHQKPRGLPREIATALDAVPQLNSAELRFALPEYKVALDTTRGQSQSDLWALLQNERGLMSLAVEGKAGEHFDELVEVWLGADKGKGARPRRFQWLCDQLRIDGSQGNCDKLRYQLFHRTAAALIMAERYKAFAAVMIIQSFPGGEVSWNDFKTFAAFLGTDVRVESVSAVPAHDSPLLYIGWINSRAATDREIAKTVA